MPDSSLLFTPLRAGAITLPNRVIMAPMTRCRAQPDGTPTELMAEYYSQRASAGLMITEATWIVPLGNGYPRSGGLCTSAHVAGWRRVTDAVHARGGRIFVQLVHAGRMTHESMAGGEQPIGPSAIAAQATLHTPIGKVPAPVPRAMTEADIAAVVAQFKTSTGLALEAGFDGVELHGASGFLISEFLSTNANRRTDAFGGTAENRARFPLAVLEAMASVAGADRVGVKLSPWRFRAHDVEETDAETLNAHLASRVNALGLAYIYIQQPITDWGEQPAPFDVLGLVRPYFRGALLAGSMFKSRADGEAVLRSGRADAVVYARAFLANPDLPARLAADAPLNQPIPAKFYSPGPEGYTDYPALPSPDPL